MSDAPRIVYISRPGVRPEDELTTLAAVYRFICFESSVSMKAAEQAPKFGAAEVRHKEEVSNVEQRPDRRSEIVITDSWE
jgi:hypothetical protein